MEKIDTSSLTDEQRRSLKKSIGDDVYERLLRADLLLDLLSKGGSGSIQWDEISRIASDFRTTKSQLERLQLELEKKLIKTP